MKALLVSALFLAPISCWSADPEYADAHVIDVQVKQQLSNGLFGAGLESDKFTEITVHLGELKITARSFPLGGGVVYIANHPEAFIVGSTVKARVAKRGELHVLAGEDDKLLKFDIQRMERVAAE